MATSSTAPLTLMTSVSGQLSASCLMRGSNPSAAGIGTASTISASRLAAQANASERSVVAAKPSDSAAWDPSADRL